ncbi:GAF domain-containing protein [Streptomyces sp. TLI_55]|uniref:GAF and ANTAR domain-containing protein n=1 Tax=Streptomyces sp. TLI_55 TaxID=1938861 RepID=UPI000BD4E3D9|nr:GAF and ANTAR domain-containing protein [Streptomyces sp. TLI_55]SNX62732.1 GAF domain-containing protein [Streptomyces sp. TLI_55]
MTSQQRLADVFVALAGGTSDGPLDVSGTLTVLATRSPSLLGVRAAGVVFAPGERAEVEVAGSDPKVSRMEHDASEQREGPGHDCHRGRRPPVQVALDGRPTRQRWPHYAPRALELGYARVAALPLRGPAGTTGALVLLSGRQSPFSPDALALGQSMADFTAIALERAGEADRSRTLNAQLELALTSRVVIEQAKGILATRLSLTMDDAFTLLRGHARSHHRPLHDVAREIVEGRADPALLDPLP